MSSELEAAIVGGCISGLVIFGALAVERTLARRTGIRSRRQLAVAEALRIYLTAIAENVRARGQGDTAVQHRSGAELLGATGQLAVLGPDQLVNALVVFERSGKHMGERESQDALLALLQTVRAEVLPGEPPLSEEIVRDLLFESPVADASGEEGST